MRLLGLSPAKIFSGFETSFFDAIEAFGPSVERVAIEVPWFKLLATVTSVRRQRSAWAHRRDLHYHTTVTAFKVKSAAARKEVLRHASDVDAIYQVGALWNPLPADADIPLILHVDYTSLLSRRRGSGWKRNPGREQDYWIEQEKELYAAAAVVLTTTENARRSLIEDYGVEPGHVVTVGGGVSPFYARREAERVAAYGSKRMLFVGKGFHGKGLDTILEALPKVRARIPEARLTVAGPASFPGGIDGVDYLGRITDRTRVRDLYFEHALFVMPSRFEPLGQVLLEAMSCGLPCIASTLDAMPEMVAHGDTGFLIEAGDADALAEYMIELLGDPDRARVMGMAGLDKLHAQYTWPAVGRRIVTELARCVQPRTAAR